MFTTYEEWRDFLQQPGAVATMPFDALDKPCPKCHAHEGYGITNDGWAYCNACSWGTDTESVWTRQPYEVLDKNGYPKDNDDPALQEQEDADALAHELRSARQDIDELFPHDPLSSC